MNGSRLEVTSAHVALLSKAATVRRLVSAWAAVGVLLVAAVGIAQASPPAAASGTFTQTAHTGAEVRFAGPNTIIAASTVGSVTGTLSGSFADSIKVVIHPNGRFTAHNTITCECTVDGKSGVVELVVVDTGEEVSPDTSVFDGRAVITGASGGLAGLRGVFEIHGTVDISSGLSTWTYSGTVHVDP